MSETDYSHDVYYKAAAEQRSQTATEWLSIADALETSAAQLRRDAIRLLENDHV